VRRGWERRRGCHRLRAPCLRPKAQGPRPKPPGPRPQAQGPRPQAQGPRPQGPGSRPQAPGPRPQAPGQGEGPKAGPPERYHLHASVVQRAVARAARQAGITRIDGPHVMRHSYATPPAAGHDVGTAQEPLGHADVSTTITHLYALSQGDSACGARSTGSVLLPAQGGREASQPVASGRARGGVHGGERLQPPYLSHNQHFSRDSAWSSATHWLPETSEPPAASANRGRLRGWPRPSRLPRLRARRQPAEPLRLPAASSSTGAGVGCNGSGGRPAPRSQRMSVRQATGGST
jgi:hypothetical protein